jgi:hypothetical protein
MVKTSDRRFPPPWSAEEQPNYYVVRDANGQQIAYVHYSNDPDRRAAAKLLLGCPNLKRLRPVAGTPRSSSQ